MGELCLVASHGYSHGLLFPEQHIFRASKEYQHLPPTSRSRQDMLKSSSLYYGSSPVEEAWKTMDWQFEGLQFLNFGKAVRRHALHDVKDSHPNSILLSLGIAKQIIRHENIWKFLTTDSSVTERDELGMCALSDMMDLHALTIDMPQEPFARGHQFCYFDESRSSLIYPSCFQNPLMDVAKDISYESEFVCEPDRQLSFISTETRMQDILLNITDLKNAKSSTKWKKHSLIVPYFERRKRSVVKARGDGSSLKLETLIPVKSPCKTKSKQPQKRKSNRKSDREDMYANNFVHACESLLSIMFDKRQHGKIAIQSLKKSGAELPQVLTQFSATIAGTGIAVLFSVICKVACSRAPFCASKILTTGLGVGLVWFSSAVNRLRDTIIHINKRSSKVDHKEEGMIKLLDQSVNEIYFRAAALLAVVVLRLA